MFCLRAGIQDWRCKGYFIVQVAYREPETGQWRFDGWWRRWCICYWSWLTLSSEVYRVFYWKIIDCTREEGKKLDFTYLFFAHEPSTVVLCEELIRNNEIFAFLRFCLKTWSKQYQAQSPRQLVIRMSETMFRELHLWLLHNILDQAMQCLPVVPEQTLRLQAEASNELMSSGSLLNLVPRSS